MAFGPTGFQPTGHEPEGHHPGGSASSSTTDTSATNPGGAASALELYASSFQVDQITNANAEDGVGYYEICQRTGFKQYPLWHPLSKMTRDGYGEYVREKSKDSRHPQDFVRSGKNEPQTGPQNPEATDVFLSAIVTASDL